MLRRMWIIASRTILILALIIVAWPIWVFNREYRKCIELPNGLYLGYEAVFDLTDPRFFIPDGTIKFADGTPLIDEKLWVVFVSDTAAYGSVEIGETQNYFAFAWREDTGVVRSSDREKFDAIVEQAGKLNYGAGPGSLGPIILMRHLAKQPGFEVKWCKTRLFRW